MLDAEFWNTVIFALVIPAAIQLYKIYQDKGGKELSKLALQVISFGLAGAFTFLNGGFMGLEWPSLPIWEGGFVEFLGTIITYAGDFVAVVGLAFGAMMGLYESVLKRIFEMIGFAPEAKVASRKEVGFWA